MPELNTKLIEACQRYINDPTEEREQAIRDILFRWIPCSERLPEEFKRVLCCTDMREMFLASVYIFDDGNYSFDDEDGMMWEGNVVAWMPLPEPYKGRADMRGEADG